MQGGLDGDVSSGDDDSTTQLQQQQLGQRLAVLRAGLDATSEELVAMERFVRQNVAACAQLAQVFEGGRVGRGQW